VQRLYKPRSCVRAQGSARAQALRHARGWRRTQRSLASLGCEFSPASSRHTHLLRAATPRTLFVG
jgi:hypothetical protein